ncbi:hypothetical protein [uncultured Aquimarina sp.]|uniref:hypothetical protein n=1 Tax=uncultured Aquimarina sp. TaxID=575652 RepID=UPI0026059E6B|nr:hypothetical protein [uncultured Aquimarina sp.]
MKKLSFIIFGLLVVLSCSKEKKSTNKVFNPFKVIENSQNQIFNIDTIQFKKITGKYGTEIYFNRDSFDVDSADKISLELKEFYDISDLIKNNIPTITKDNKLLESSGVIFLNFKKNGKKINLKDSSSITIKFPVHLSGQDKIFNGEVDSIGQLSWSKTDSYFSIIRFNKKIHIDEPYDITLDSLSYYQDLWRKRDSIYELTASDQEKIESRVISNLLINKLGWINIDRFIEESIKKDFSVMNDKALDGIIFYTIYENLNSFTSYYPAETENILLTDIPILENTFLIAVGIKDGELFAQKILMNDKKSIKLSLKAINQNELNELLKK